MQENQLIRVLHVVPFFYPATAFGGPVFSTLAICDGVSETPGFEISVLTSNASTPHARQPLNLQENPATFPAGYKVRYCKATRGTFSLELMWRLPQAVRNADIVHITGPYDFQVIPTLALCRLLGKRVVWSPRGGFQATVEWPEAPKRRLKKVFERVCNLLRPRETVLHLTAEIERKTSCGRFPGIGTAVIPNSIAIPEAQAQRDWRPEGRIRLGFLSRVHQKKGLDLLLPAMEQLPDHVTLDVYGSGDPTYIDTLKLKSAELGLADRVDFRGHVEGKDKSIVYRSFDIMVLPTHSENFGIVVAEALAHGTPVICTVNAPWQGLETHDCGHWVDATPEALAAAIRKLENADLAALGANGRTWMTREYGLGAMTDDFVALYTRVVSCTAQKE